MTAAPKRPSLITLLGPVAAISLCYSWLFYTPLRKEIQAKEGQLATAEARSSEVRDQLITLRGQLVASTAEQAQLQEQREGRREELEAVRVQRSRVARRMGRSGQPALEMERLGTLLASHDLEVVENEFGGSGGSLPATLAEVPKLLEISAGGQSNGTTFRIKARGRFASLQRALQELANSDIEALPLSIEMESARLDSSQRTWVLTVLI